MPKTIKVNVEDHKLIDSGRVCEDVTEVALPDLEHITIAIENISGLAGNLDLPLPSKLQASEYTINHNNGTNCERLCDPVMHEQEFRTVRQVLDTAKAAIRYESVKYRLRGMPKAATGGSITKGNPWGGSERYSLLRYEEIVNGKQTKLLDWLANKVVINGKDYSLDVSKLL